MNCTHIRGLLPLYWDSCFAEEDKRTVDQHLPQCEDCVRQFNRWMISLTMIRTLRSEDSSRSDEQRTERVADSVMKRIYSDQQAERSVLHTPPSYSVEWHKRFQIAAAASFLLILGLFVFSLTEMFGIQDALRVPAESEMTVAVQEAPRNDLAPSYGIWMPLSVLAGTLMLSMLLLTAWYDRLRH